MLNITLLELLSNATDSQKEAATVLLDSDLMEFELCVIKKEIATKDDCALHSVSSSSREGMAAMSIELLQNLKKQWGEIELCEVIYNALCGCSEATIWAVRNSVNNILTSRKEKLAIEGG